MCHQCELKPVYEFTNQRKLCRICFIKYFQKKVLYTIRKFSMIKPNDVIGYKNVGDFRGGPEEGCIPRRDENFFEAPKNIQKNIFTRGIVLEDVLKMFAEKSTIELVRLPTKGAHFVRTPRRCENFSEAPKHFSKKMFTRGNKIAIASTIDLEANKIIHILIKGNVKDLKQVSPVNGRIIKPLYLFLDEEVLLYAKLKNLKFKRIKESTQGCTPKNIQKNIFTKGNKISIFIDKLEKKHPEVKRAVVNSFLEM